MAGFPGGGVWTKATPRGRGLEIELPAPLALWCQEQECRFHSNIPDFLDIGVSEGWGLTFDQTSMVCNIFFIDKIN